MGGGASADQVNPPGLRSIPARANIRNSHLRTVGGGNGSGMGNCQGSSVCALVVQRLRTRKGEEINNGAQKLIS